ncbi:MAG: O-antigen ligase family protein [Kiritimatiellae bacterium]|nr:O-antigen ligase family protein [Kiritimatiellia bacterium]
MRKFFEYIPVVLILLTLVAFSWILGGASGPHLLPVIPWVWALTLETLLFFPQRYSLESVSEARARVWKALSRDPITYTAIAFMLLLIMPFFNRGLCSVCDYPMILSGVDPAPPIPYSPFCVNIREHLGVVIWFVPSLTAMLAVRHALLHKGRRALVHFLVWNGALLAALGFLQQATGAVSPFWLETEDPVHFFSSFGYPNMAGAFFVAVFAVSAGLWQDNVRRYFRHIREKKVSEIESTPSERYCPMWVKTHYMLIPVGLTFFASLATLSRAAIMLAFVILGFWFVYLCLSLFTRHKSVKQVKLYLWMIAGIVLTVIMVSVFAPKEFADEINTLSASSVADRVTGKAQYHTRVATEIFKDYPLFGVGGWGYKHFCLEYMTDAERKQLQVVGGINVHNDHLQILCEHGLVGGILLLSVVIMLFFPFLKHWGYTLKVANFTKGKDLPRPTALFCVPAVVVGVLIAAAANIVHAFGDCVFRSPAVLSQFLILLAAVEGFLHDDRGEK